MYTIDFENGQAVNKLEVHKISSNRAAHQTL